MKFVRHISTAGFLAMTLVGCHRQRSLPYYNTPDFTPIFRTPSDEQAIAHTIAPFRFTDQHSNPVGDKTVTGKVHVANFMFTSCGSICPVMTQHLKLVQQAFAGNGDVAILSFSVTPWIDNVATLQKYADVNGITSPDWHLLTGSKARIYSLARTSYFAEENLGFTRDSTQFLHTEHFVLVDRHLHIRGVYNGTLQLEAEQLIRDIRELLAER